MFVMASVDLSVNCLASEFYFISFLMREETTATECKDSVRRKLQQWAQGCVYSHMHDVIEYRSSAYVYMYAYEQEKRKSLLLNVYVRGINVRQARSIFDIIDIHT